jgi:acetoacetyl-CoA reductase/3-oxoacyl-[acyl-carrier protein] reductase
VAPGAVESRIQKENEARYEGYRQKIEQGNPLGRFVTAEEVAGCYAFLASDDAQYMTGSTLLIEGGDLL